jgi:ADP-heptose:LPS heptosyltransferase
MYILYAPVEKFGNLPPKLPLVTPELLFTNNIALCYKRYWKDQALLQGIKEISPKQLTKIRKNRRLNLIIINARGGIGDCLWLVPLAKALRKKYPRADIRLTTDANRVPLFLGCRWVNQVLSVPADQLPQMFFICDEIYDAGGCATYYPGHKKKHAIDIIFERMEMELPKDPHDRRPDILLSQTDGNQAETFLVDHGINPRKDRYIVIGLESSTPNRNWPYKYSLDLTNLILKDGYKVVWMGENKEFKNTTPFTCSCGYYIELTTEQNPGVINFNCPSCHKQNTISIKAPPKGVANLAAETALRIAITIIGMADAFIGPDSGLLNIAGALTTPSVGLFGPIPHEIRTKYFIQMITLQGQAHCAPCIEHWTECRHGYPSPCMRDIKVDQAYKAVKEALKKWPRNLDGKMPLK